MSFLLTRAVIMTAATLVGTAGLWTALSQILAPTLDYFPINAQEALDFDSAQESADRAARFAVVRGDLWAIAAVTKSAAILFTPPDQKPGAKIQQKIATARTVAEYAARLSPSDARVWLVLADLLSRSPQNKSGALESLKLSYYMGSNEFQLAPVRLAIAGRIDPDDDLKTLVQSEVGRVVLKRPDLKPAIVAAYKTATPSMRKLFEGTLKGLEPNLVKSLADTKER